MLKRDEFLQKLANLNNPAYLESKIDDLEKFIDKELTKEENIINFINNHPSGYTSNVAYTDGIVIPSQYAPTYAVHRDPDVKSNTANQIKSGNFTVWTSDSSELILNGTLANTSPWVDKTLDNKILGEISIKLPDNTNKNLALLLADKYRSTKIGSDGRPTGGYWSFAPLPGKPEYASSSGISYPDAVTVKQQGNDLYMVFRLYPA